MNFLAFGLVTGCLKVSDHILDLANVTDDGVCVKKNNPTEIVHANKFLGSGTFSTCHPAQYRGILVAVKEFK